MEKNNMDELLALLKVGSYRIYDTIGVKTQSSSVSQCVSASQVTEQLKKNWGEHQALFIPKLFSDWGNYFESKTREYAEQLLQRKIMKVDGLTIYGDRGCFQPDGLTLDLEEEPSKRYVITIYEFKSPIKRCSKGLYYYYKHQLNFSAYILRQAIAAVNVDIKLVFCAVRFAIVERIGGKIYKLHLSKHDPKCDGFCTTDDGRQSCAIRKYVMRGVKQLGEIVSESTLC